MNIKTLENKVTKVLKKSKLNIEFDDITSYDNGSGMTHQLFVYKSNPLFSYIKDNFESIEDKLSCNDIQVCEYEEDEDLEEMFTFEYDNEEEE